MTTTLQTERKMSDAEAVSELRKMTTNSFAQSLVEKLARYGSFTDSQANWAHRLANEHRFGGEVSRQFAEGDFSPIVALIKGAGEKLKSPRITFPFEDCPLECYVAGSKSQYAGCIYVTNGARGGGIWYGRIHGDGRFEPSKYCTEQVTGFLKLFAADPAGIAAQCGKTTGRCSFCRRPLSDERSLAVGYGPTCADAWKLPWGDK